MTLFDVCDNLGTCYSFFSKEGFRFFMYKHDTIIALIIGILFVGFVVYYIVNSTKENKTNCEVKEE